jgi:hypothetical protein
MTVHDTIVEFVKREYPGAQVNVYVLPSGAAVVDIKEGTEFITVECSVSRGIGLSHLYGRDDAFSGHDVVFGRVEDAISVLNTWLKTGRHTVDRNE